MTIKKLKVLIIIPNDIIGGAENYLKMIALYFKDEEVSIIFLTKKSSSFKWNDLEKDINIRYISSKNEKIGMLQYVFSLFCHERNFDYIFTSQIHINGMIGILLKSRLLKTKWFIARESTSIFLRFKGIKLFQYKLVYYLAYRKINLLICQTNLMKEQLISHFPAITKRTKLKVIPNPIDLKQIRKLSREDIDKNLPDEYIVTAGRLIPEKGYDILIKAYVQIKSKFPTVKLLILGEGKLQLELKLLIEELGLKENVVLVGNVNNVFPYFKNAKLCVVSSRIEGFPNVLLQMMSQNDKVVSTLCAGDIENIPAVIKCAPNDIEALSKALLSTLKNTDTQNNRTAFDKYLSERNVSTFIKIIDRELALIN